MQTPSFPPVPPHVDLRLDSDTPTYRRKKGWVAHRRCQRCTCTRSDLLLKVSESIQRQYRDPYTGFFVRFQSLRDGLDNERLSCFFVRLDPTTDKRTFQGHLGHSGRV